MKCKVALNIPDCHIPWHDEKAFDIMLQIAKDLNESQGIDEVNILGDFLDFFWFSLHGKLPSTMGIKETLKDEIYQGIKHLEMLREAFPKAKITFIEGNHEYRMVRYIVAKCPELYELFTLPELLQFDRLSIDYVPFGKSQLHSCLGTDYYLRHQPYNMGKNFASSTAHNKAISLGCGHVHRNQSYTMKRGDGTEVTVRSCGWMGDETQPIFDYMDHTHWSKGFEFVFAYGESDWFIHEVNIKNNKAVYNGFLYY